MAEEINIGISKIDEPIKLDIGAPSPTPSQKSVNFGPGLDMLMNTKVKSSPTTPKHSGDDINIDDLNKLESELNDLSDIGGGSSGPSISLDIKPEPIKASSSGISLSKPIELNSGPAIKLDTVDSISGSGLGSNEKISLGQATSSQNNKAETWDGYKSFNNIPVDPSKDIQPKEKPMSKEELLRKKFEYLRKLERFEKKGISLSKKYTMESNLDEMRGEYEMIVSEREKSSSIRFQGKIMTAVVTALEYLNEKFDPFDLKLDGWSDSVTENIDDYDDIFAELHEKYSSKAKMAPELKLLFQLGGSAVMLHMTNTMFKSAMPGMDDIMRQNPELMQQFQQAAVNSMGQQNPNFGNFMNGVMQNHGAMSGQRSQPQQQSQPFYSNNHGSSNIPPSMPNRPDIPPGPPSNRPDIGMSRGQPSFNDSENMEGSFGNFNQPQSSTNQTRPDMKGPKDISDLLGNLKPKTSSSTSATTRKINTQSSASNVHKMESGSTISIDELMSISKDADGYPKKSKRKPRSERNTVSLDI
jgi:hypothetical protein